jgi:hypothetical protein
MKVYLAALFRRMEEMGRIADQLKAHGYEITSRWVYGGEATAGSTEACALLDIEDVIACDMLISFTHPRGTMTSGGGRHVEFGYALALNKICVIIGPRENVFHHHPSVIQYGSIDEFLTHFASSSR